jgi:hypothetical protein
MIAGDKNGRFCHVGDAAAADYPGRMAQAAATVWAAAERAAGRSAQRAAGVLALAAPSAGLGTGPAAGSFADALAAAAQPAGQPTPRRTRRRCARPTRAFGWEHPPAGGAIRRRPAASAQATESRAARAKQAGRDDPDGLEAGLAAEAEAAAAGLLATARREREEAADDVDAARRIFARAQAEASRRSRAASEARPGSRARGQQPGDQQ